MANRLNQGTLADEGQQMLSVISKSGIAGFAEIQVITNS